MVLHLVVFRWRESVSGPDVEALCKELEAFGKGVEGMVEYRFGPDLGLREGNADFGIAALLSSEAALAGYLDSPAHHRLVELVIAPMAASRTAAQIAVEGSRPPSRA